MDQTNQGEDCFEVWPENWPALEMFLRLQTQWIYTGMGGTVGLNYQSLEFLFRTYRVKDRRRMLEDIRELELGALESMRKQAESKKDGHGP